MCYFDVVKRAGTQRNEGGANHGASFTPVYDSRKRKVRGLWQRGERFYAQLRVDLVASQCVMTGLDFMTIAAWLGHSDGGILVGKVYGHLVDTHKKAVARKLVFFAPQAC